MAESMRSEGWQCIESSAAGNAKADVTLCGEMVSMCCVKPGCRTDEADAGTINGLCVSSADKCSATAVADSSCPAAGAVSGQCCEVGEMDAWLELKSHESFNEGVNQQSRTRVASFRDADDKALKSAATIVSLSFVALIPSMML